MKFSLVLATIGRYDEVRRFLESLAAQSHRDFELIVADQNESDDVELLCQEYSSAIDITHLHLDRAGLSLARNAGLKVAQGDVVAFPDDDCEYPQDLLRHVEGLLRTHPGVDGITGLSRDKATGHPSAGRFDGTGGIVTYGNVWRRHISYTIFMRARVVAAIGGFDEELGLGAKFGSEETDFLLRAIERGFQILYCPEVTVYHPNPLVTYDVEAAQRAYSYGTGIGAVCKKHIFGCRSFGLLPQTIMLLIRPLIGCLVYGALDRDRSRFYLQSCRGRISGFVRYRASPRGREGS